MGRLIAVYVAKPYLTPFSLLQNNAHNLDIFTKTDPYSGGCSKEVCALRGYFGPL